MPRVYAPQVPSRLDTSIRAWIPTVNMKPAEKFGELVIMFTPEECRFVGAPMVAALKERMKDFGPDDYLVAVGNPTLIAAAAGIAARKNGGRLRVLAWDRQAADYIATELRV